MSNKFLIGIGVAFFFVFVLGIAAVVGIHSITGQAMVASQPATVASPAVTTVVSAPVSPQAVPTTVLDSDLARLAVAVKLGKANMGDVSREVWARETPVAE